MYTSMKNPEADCTFLWEQSVGLIRRSPDQGYGLGSFSQLVSTPHLSEKGSISPDSLKYGLSTTILPTVLTNITDHGRKRNTRSPLVSLIPDHGFLQCPSLRTNRS